MNIIQTAVTLFLITNPIGNAPAFLALLKPYPLARQRYILLRESCASFLLTLFFLFLGEAFLTQIAIRDYTVSYCGGILLILVALDMIFTKHEEQLEKETSDREPFLVPIATPLLAGPGVLTMIMIFGHETEAYLPLVAAIFLSSLAVVGVLVAAPGLVRFMGKTGLLVLERLMGLILCLLGMEMIVEGTQKFVDSL